MQSSTPARAPLWSCSPSGRRLAVRPRGGVDFTLLDPLSLAVLSFVLCPPRRARRGRARGALARRTTRSRPPLPAHGSPRSRTPSRWRWARSWCVVVLGARDCAGSPAPRRRRATRRSGGARNRRTVVGAWVTIQEASPGSSADPVIPGRGEASPRANRSRRQHVEERLQRRIEKLTIIRASGWSPFVAQPRSDAAVVEWARRPADRLGSATRCGGRS